jgi:hypothetical protein
MTLGFLRDFAQYGRSKYPPHDVLIASRCVVTLCRVGLPSDSSVLLHRNKSGPSDAWMMGRIMGRPLEPITPDTLIFTISVEPGDRPIAAVRGDGEVQIDWPEVEWLALQPLFGPEYQARAIARLLMAARLGKA